MKRHRSLTLALAATLVALAALACSKGNSTPTEAFRTFYNAAKKSDAKAAKTIMPKKMLERAGNEAKAKGEEFDARLASELNRIGKELPDTLEMRDEKIEGDTATLEFKEGENWRRVSFVKEDDGWKMKR